MVDAGESRSRSVPGRSWPAVLLAAVLLAAPSSAVAQSWTAAVCASCGRIADLHNDCCAFGAVCGDCCTCTTRWTASADFLWLNRTRGKDLPLVIADVNGFSIPVLDVKHLGFNVNGGARTRLAKQFESGRELEFIYLGVFDQTARQTVSVDPTVPLLNSVTYRFFGNIGGNDTAYRAEYQSDLHSAEANLRFACWNGFVPLVGFRWLHLSEALELHEVATPGDGARAEIRNDLVGAQLGLHKELWTYATTRIDATLKLGFFQNEVDLYADQHTGGIPVATLDRSFSQTATMGEVHITFVWQPCPYLAIRAGYSGLWLNDVPIVANQLDRFSLATGLGSLQRSTVGFHGGHVGFEAKW